MNYEVFQLILDKQFFLTVAHNLQERLSQNVNATLFEEKEEETFKNEFFSGPARTWHLSIYFQCLTYQDRIQLC